ncbi:TonB family protein [Acidobacteria bacterium AB60]|nr:TonB family protein [Acidobacteria bacterium AB60]
MRLLVSLLCMVAAASQLHVCLHAAPLAPESGDGPAGLLGRAWPFYDFANTEVKPWHLKVSYAVYDAKGRHPSVGVFQYWWVSGELWRSSWKRAGMSHTDWHLSHGRLAYEASGDPLTLFEYKLEAALIAPLPRARDLDQAQIKGVPGGRASCLAIVPGGAAGGGEAKGPFPTYCFDATAPVLRSMSSPDRVVTEYRHVRAWQGCYLPHDVQIRSGNRPLLTAHVEVLEPIAATDAALRPPASAMKTEVFVNEDVGLKDVDVETEVARGLLKKRIEPEYPAEAKSAGVQGTVVLEAMIGTDGRIHDLRVVSAPAASLAASSFAAVSQWEYRPYVMGGRAVPVQTTVTVTFSLGG